jgi:ankyrin repeat protein
MSRGVCSSLSVLSKKALLSNNNLAIPKCPFSQAKCKNLLLKHDAKVNITDKNGSTPLHLAAMKDHVDIIHLLLEYKADIDCCDNTGKTPLFIACHKKKFSAASDLIEHIMF